MLHRPSFFSLLAAAALAAAGLVSGCGRGSSSGGPVVGFAQEGVENQWRAANTNSMKAEAKAQGIDLRFADGQSRQENQIRAIRSFVAQKVDAIVVSPIVATGWDPALREARAAGIPVVLIDRAIYTEDPSLYACYIGSDAQEGARAEAWMARKMGGKGRIVELQGTPGAAPTNDRHNAFVRALAAHPGMTVIASQSGDYRRAAGKEVMEALLKRFGPHGIDAVYSHNDEMALGAAQAIEQAGLRPGRDIVLVSIDGIHEGLQAIAEGRLNCIIEYTPEYGPAAFRVVKELLGHRPVPKKVTIEGELFDAGNAAAALPQRTY